jgi:hypothetical protein
MALHIDKNGNVKVVLPPKELTLEEKKKLENVPVNEELIQKALQTRFTVVYG